MRNTLLAVLALSAGVAAASYRALKDASYPAPKEADWIVREVRFGSGEVLQAESTDATRARVTQTGFDESARWRRYYEVIGFGWSRSLASLKSLL